MTEHVISVRWAFIWIALFAVGDTALIIWPMFGLEVSPEKAIRDALVLSTFVAGLYVCTGRKVPVA